MQDTYPLYLEQSEIQVYLLVSRQCPCICPHVHRSACAPLTCRGPEPDSCSGSRPAAYALDPEYMETVGELDASTQEGLMTVLERMALRDVIMSAADPMAAISSIRPYIRPNYVTPPAVIHVCIWLVSALYLKLRRIQLYLRVSKSGDHCIWHVGFCHARHTSLRRA